MASRQQTCGTERPFPIQNVCLHPLPAFFQQSIISHELEDLTPFFTSNVPNMGELASKCVRTLVQQNVFCVLLFLLKLLGGVICVGRRWVATKIIRIQPKPACGLACAYSCITFGMVVCPAQPFEHLRQPNTAAVFSQGAAGWGFAACHCTGVWAQQ